jgi:hypothetical protein
MREESFDKSRRYRFAGNLAKEFIGNHETVVFTAVQWLIPVRLSEVRPAPAVTERVNCLQNPNLAQRQYAVFNRMDFGVG